MKLVYSLNVAETGVDHAQVEAQGFYHNGIHFRTAELKAALELAYPERFLMKQLSNYKIIQDLRRPSMVLRC